MNAKEKEQLRKLLGEPDDADPADPAGAVDPAGAAADPAAPPAADPAAPPAPATPRQEEADGFAKVKAALESIPERIAEALGTKPGQPGGDKPDKPAPEKPPAQGTRLARFFGWPDKEKV